MGGKCKDPSNSFFGRILNLPTLFLKLCKLNVLGTKSICLASIYLDIAKVLRMLPSDL